MRKWLTIVTSENLRDQASSSVVTLLCALSTYFVFNYFDLLDKQL